MTTDEWLTQIGKLEQLRGIYVIKNTCSNKYYVGKSEDLGRRLRNRFNGLQHIKYNPAYAQPKELYEDVQFFGIENFSFCVCVLSDDDDLEKCEQDVINYFNDTYSIYNHLEFITKNIPPISFKKLGLLYKKIKFTSLSNDCWEHTYKEKYPYIKFNKNKFAFHRIMYCVYMRMINGEDYQIPENKCIRHLCENARCVNPLHLEYGGHQENSDDYWKNNRTETTKTYIPGKRRESNRKYRGVHFSERYQKFEVMIQFGAKDEKRKSVYLGRYDDEEYAARVYDAYVIENGLHLPQPKPRKRKMLNFP